jgi:hypothetical protein
MVLGPFSVVWDFLEKERDSTREMLEKSRASENDENIIAGVIF